MKSLFGLMAAFCLLALPSTAFASNTAPATFDSIAVSSGSPPNATTEPASIRATSEATTSSNFASASDRHDMVIRIDNATHETALAALHRLHDGEPNRAGADLTYMVKDRSRDLGLSSNSIMPRRHAGFDLYRWRSVPDYRPLAGHGLDKPLAS